MTRQGSDSDGELVSFVDVTKTYNGQDLVVRNLNLVIKRGEFLTMLGPSGSGKTTTLMMLAGFEAVTRGDILLKGKSMRNVPPYMRNMGMVFQNYALFPHMTVEENLAFPLEARGVPKNKIPEKVGAALDMVRLAPFGRRRPNELSGGQQQRVAVARALVYQPELILMDEPLGALDRKLREQMQLELRRIHESVGVTIVYVTHDQGEALTMSDRIAVFNNGAIQQIGPPKEVYEHPENSFVAEFIGENNRLIGTVQHANGTTCDVEVEGGIHISALSINTGGVGTKTAISLRPESVLLNPRDGVCEQVFDARVEEIVYFGDHTRLRVTFSDNDQFVVKVPRTSQAAEITMGQACRIGWNRQDCRALNAL